MKVFTVMFHTGNSDTVVSVVSSEKVAKKRAERFAAKLYPANKYYWQGCFFTCDDRDEEWSIHEWTVKE